MARRISWFSRIMEIRKSVEKSDRSHWFREDLEVLFQLQPSAANALIGLLPRGRGPGRAAMVERDGLLQFLDEVERLGKLPTARVKASRKKVRTMTLKPAREVARGSVEKIPATVGFEPGELTVRHAGEEDLIEQLWALALAARDDEDRFRRLVGAEPVRSSPPDEMDAMFADLSQREAEYRKRPGVVVSIAASADNEGAA